MTCMSNVQPSGVVKGNTDWRLVGLTEACNLLYYVQLTILCFLVLYLITHIRQSHSAAFYQPSSRSGKPLSETEACASPLMGQYGMGNQYRFQHCCCDERDVFEQSLSEGSWGISLHCFPGAKGCHLPHAHSHPGQFKQTVTRALDRIIRAVKQQHCSILSL